jgi:hypothetical protein
VEEQGYICVLIAFAFVASANDINLPSNSK